MSHRSYRLSDYSRKYCPPTTYKRSFDCCTPLSASLASPRRSSMDGYDSVPRTPTYGTYFYTSESRTRYKTSNPASCQCNCCPHACTTPTTPRPQSRDSAYFSRESPSSSSRRRGSTGSKTITIDVIDKTDSLTGRRYGNRFPFAIPNRTSVADILDSLAPDSRRHKVMVCWDDGEREELNEQISMGEIRRYAAFFEIKKNKHVHWS